MHFGKRHPMQLLTRARAGFALAFLILLAGCGLVSNRAIQNGMTMSFQNGGRFGPALLGSSSIKSRTTLFYNSTPLYFQRTSVSPFSGDW